MHDNEQRFSVGLAYPAAGERSYSAVVANIYRLSEYFP